MNDPYAAFSQAAQATQPPQANAVLNSQPTSVGQSGTAAASSVSATERLEQLLKQLQDEQLAPVPTTAGATTVPTGATVQTTNQDFISALASVPAPPQVSPFVSEAQPNRSSLDAVIKTIGQQYIMGQPKLTELLELAKKTAVTLPPATTVSQAALDAAVPELKFTPSVSQNQLPDFPAMQLSRPATTTSPISTTAQSATPTPTEPKITVMPPAVAPVIPGVAQSAPPSSSSTADAAPTPRRRILSQYLQNLSTHLKQRGLLHLPSYTKLVAVR